MRPLHSTIIPLLVTLVLQTSALAQWRQIQYGSSQFWNEVFFVDNDHGWITGQTPLLVRTVDGGSTWIPTSLPGASFSANRDICFLDRSNGFVSGEDGVWKTMDGGASWTAISPPQLLGQTLGAVWFIDPNTGVCAFGNCDATLVTFCRTLDGGRTWRVVQYIEAVDVSVGGITYQNGTWYASGGLGKFWRSTDNGVSWSTTNTASQGWQEDLISRFGNLFIASANGGSCSAAFGGRVLRSSDGGVTWTSTLFSPLMWGVTMVSPAIGWVCGDGGRAFKTTDGGLTWVDSSCGMDPLDRIDDIWFSDADHGWAVGDGIYRKVPIPQAAANGATTICRGDTTTLTGSGGDIYSWSPSGSLSCSDCPSPRAFPDTTTVYTVAVYDSGGCFTTDTVIVHVSRVGALVQQRFTVCQGDSVALPVIGGVRVQWASSPDIACDTCRAPMVRPDTTTTYRVTVFGADGCRETLVTTVNVVPRPRVVPRYTLCRGGEVTLVASGGTTYEWSPTTALSCSDCPTPSARPDSTTTYHVRMRTAGGCETNDSVVVTVVTSRLQVIGLDSNIIVIDTTELRTTRCRRYVLRNLSEVQKVIDRPWLWRNREFSIPPSELPIVIPPDGEVMLTICYRPSAEHVQRDTLTIPDECPQSIPVQAVGKRFDITDGLVCDSVSIAIGELFDGQFLRIGSGGGEVVRGGVASTHWFVGRDDDVRIVLVDINGTYVRELYRDRAVRGAHTLHWSTSDLSSGLYFLRIRAGSILAESRVVVVR